MLKPRVDPLPKVMNTCGSMMHLAILQVTDRNNYALLKQKKKHFCFAYDNFCYKTNRRMLSADIPSSPAPSRLS